MTKLRSRAVTCRPYLWTFMYVKLSISFQNIIMQTGHSKVVVLIFVNNTVFLYLYTWQLQEFIITYTNQKLTLGSSFSVLFIIYSTHVLRNRRKYPCCHSCLIKYINFHQVVSGWLSRSSFFGFHWLKLLNRIQAYICKSV